MEAKTVQVSFDEIREVAHKGVRRAVVFLGLGLNAAYDKDFKDYRLSKITQIDIVSPHANDEEIAAFKNEFAFWVMGSGLREVIETFNIFLDSFHEACLLFKMANGGFPSEQVRRAVEKFHYVGLDGKLETLKKELGLGPKSPHYLISINKARNCLTHRRGIIGREDVGKDGKFHLKWRGIETFVRSPSGEDISLIPDNSRMPIFLKDGGRVMLRFPERSRTFSVGERIVLTPVDLSEICQVAAEETNALCNGGLAYAARLGIPRN